jgi:hypothetical protein
MTISRVFPRGAAAMAALLLTTAMFSAAPARANIVFDFSGTCKTNCIGTATGVLTLTDSYSFGSEITGANFISFDYSSSSRSFDITSLDDSDFVGGLNADGSFPFEEVVFAEVGPSGLPTFEAAANGFVVQTTEDPAAGDEGNSNSFTLVRGAVPEPSTWVMMLLGFAGLGYADYRKVKQTAVTRP